VGMRTVRAVAVVGMMLGFGVGVAACSSQGDKFAEQLRGAGYTDVSVSADYDKKKNSKTKKTTSKLDDFEATAKAGSCQVTLEQDKNATSYVVETVNGKDVSFTDLKAADLIAEMAKQGVTC
jgi:hypothetical protein